MFFICVRVTISFCDSHRAVSHLPVVFLHDFRVPSRPPELPQSQCKMHAFQKRYRWVRVSGGFTDCFLFVSGDHFPFAIPTGLFPIYLSCSYSRRVLKTSRRLLQRHTRNSSQELLGRPEDLLTCVPDPSLHPDSCGQLTSFSEAPGPIFFFGVSDPSPLPDSRGQLTTPPQSPQELPGTPRAPKSFPGPSWTSQKVEILEFGSFLQRGLPKTAPGSAECAGPGGMRGPGYLNIY